MNEKIQSYIEKVASGLTDEAMDELAMIGDGTLMSDEELSKLFSKKFMHSEECPHGEDFYLVYNESNKEMELFSTFEERTKWSVKCDINNVQSIISCAIDCINHCIREKI